MCFPIPLEKEAKFVPLAGGTADEIDQFLVNFLDSIGLGDDIREHQMTSDDWFL